MKKLITLFIFCSSFAAANAQSGRVPCSGPEYRQFDFWIGEWEAFGPNGQKGGDSKISLILDSCIILEEWTSASVQRDFAMQEKVLIPTMQPLNNGSKPG